MKEVILIFPKMVLDQKFEQPNVPLSVITLGTMLLKNGYKPKIIDQRTDLNWQETLDEALKGKPLMVGISCLSGPPIHFSLEIAAFIRKKSNLPIVWGGLHPTLEPKTTIEHPLVDMLIVGEAEVSITELAQAFEGNINFNDVGGLVYKKNGDIIYNSRPAEIIPLSEIPPLRFDLVNYTRYIQNPYRLKSPRVTVFIETSRGCFNRCAYCTRSKRPNRWRMLSPEDTVGRFRYYKEEFGIDTFVLADENFFVDLKRVENIVRLMEKEDLGIFWDGACRPEYIAHRIELDLLKRMTNVGFQTTVIGAESGSNRMLKFINKGCTSEDIILANRKLVKTRIRPGYVSIVGFPTETIEDVKDTEKLVQTLVDDNPRASTTIVKLIPTPGSVILDECVKAGYPLPQKMEDWVGIFDPLFLQDKGWINQDTLLYIEKQEYYFKLLSQRKISSLAEFVYPFFSKIRKLRHRLNYYGFPFERWIYNLLKRLWLKINQSIYLPK